MFIILLRTFRLEVPSVTYSNFLKITIDFNRLPFSNSKIIIKKPLFSCIRLEGLVLEHAAFCHYEPELFPGLIYRMVQPKIVLLIFVSGKVVLTGAKEEKHIQDAFEKIYAVLRAFKKKTNYLKASVN